MMKKENQRIALTKRLLKENLLKLMSKKKIQDITVMELCEASEINRSTFYKHYGKAYDVLQDMEYDIINDLAEICDNRIAGQNWSMSKRVELLCEYLKQHEHFAKLLLQNNETGAQFARLLFSASHVKALHESILSNIENPDSKKLIMTFMTTGSYQMIRQWLLEDIPKSPLEMGLLISQMEEQA